MKDEIEKILNKYVYGKLAYPHISTEILDLFTSTIDSCEDEIQILCGKHFGGGLYGNFIKDIINIIKDKIRGSK
jgi:hypothetical protein